MLSRGLVSRKIVFLFSSRVKKQVRFQSSICLSVSSWFCLPSQGMSEFELLNRSSITSFPLKNPNKSSSSSLSSSLSSSSSSLLSPLYSLLEPSLGGKEREEREREEREGEVLCPSSLASIFRASLEVPILNSDSFDYFFFGAGHVTHPFQYLHLYPQQDQQWIRHVTEKDTTYWLEIMKIDPSANRAFSHFALPLSSRSLLNHFESSSSSSLSSSSSFSSSSLSSFVDQETLPIVHKQKDLVFLRFPNQTVETLFQNIIYQILKEEKEGGGERERRGREREEEELLLFDDDDDQKNNLSKKKEELTKEELEEILMAEESPLSSFPYPNLFYQFGDKEEGEEGEREREEGERERGELGREKGGEESEREIKVEEERREEEEGEKKEKERKKEENVVMCQGVEVELSGTKEEKVSYYSPLAYPVFQLNSSIYAKTARPLSNGMCGGPVVSPTTRDCLGIIEGTVPLSLPSLSPSLFSNDPQFQEKTEREREEFCELVTKEIRGSVCFIHWGVLVQLALEGKRE